MDLKTNISEGERIFKMYARRLEKLGIVTFEDFLFHIPHRYEDYSLVSKVAHVQPGEIVTIQGTVLEMKNEFTKRGKKLQRAKIQDETGSIDVIWFNQLYLTRAIPIESTISLSGKVDFFGRRITMQSPDFEILYGNEPPIHTGRLVPIYPETAGVSSKWLRRQVFKLLKEHIQQLTEHLPNSIRKEHNLMEFTKALEQIHFPDSLELADKARKRLSFDELFLIQIANLERKTQWKKHLVGFPFSLSSFQKHTDDFIKSLPFELTNAQKKAVEQIFSDLSSEKPMNRLLEGDVGSGKTVVAAIGMYLSYLNGFQSALMAPTEILAQQHHNTISNLLSPFGVKVGLQTGSKKIGIKKQESRSKNPKKENLNSKFMIHDSFDILIGTHALLSEKIQFEKLGLVVIDEQQRFGVEQRAVIRSKGKNPHLLTMTATPIPRTVALTLYGDLDLSYLDEMPVGRKKVKTWLVPKEKRKAAYEWIEKQITETDSQCFIICPFIEESETMQTVKAAKKEFEKLQKDIFPNLRLGLMHGKMKAKEKDEILEEFRGEKIDILVATPVVEVGIDIPNATIMLIEASERFGLSQLHQLRGRVGRGDKQSYCLLFTESENQQTASRLKSMETIYNGAKLSELDLKLRGSGDIYGTMQHGRFKLKIADFSDISLVQQTRQAAHKVFPELDKYPLLMKKLQEVTLKQVSPD